MRALLALPLLLAAGCAPFVTPLGLAVTAGAMGGSMAMQERGLDGAVSDAGLALAINESWLAHDAAIFRRVSTAIHDGVVVLTGHVRYRETAVRAEALARGVPGVREVINHVRVEEPPGLGTIASDAWITARLRLALTFAPGINAVNYGIDTVAGTVFVSGIARDQAELERVVAQAKHTPGVRDVVTAVRLRSEPLALPANLADARGVAAPRRRRRGDGPGRRWPRLRAPLRAASQACRVFVGKLYTRCRALPGALRNQAPEKRHGVCSPLSNARGPV